MAKISPCQQKCKLDPNLQICVSCERTLEQIINWTKYTDAERQEIIDKLRR